MKKSNRKKCRSAPQTEILSVKVFFLSISRVREREMALSTLIYVKPLDYKVPQLILEMSNKNGRSA